MANDIKKIISANPIKNGTILVSCCARTGSSKVIDTYVTNKPTITDIESKYDNKFDERTYYTDNDLIDGGPA